MDRQPHWQKAGHYRSVTVQVFENAKTAQARVSDADKLCMSTGRDRRRKPRSPRVTLSPLRLHFQEQRGVQQVVPARLVDLTEHGCGLEVESDLAVNMPITILGDITNQGGGREVQVRGRVAWSEASSDWTWRVGIEFEAPLDLGRSKGSSAKRESMPLEDTEDFYELLQLSPNADNETIQRVFRILATRYHPDNKETGDTEVFRRVHQAYTTLLDPERRAAYDVDHQARNKLRWKIFDQPQSAQGMHAERAKRHGILSLLYTKRVANPAQPGVSIVEFEDMLGVPREHLDFSLWFLKESGFAVRTDNGRFSITIKGVIEAEAEVVPRDPERREDRLIEAPDGVPSFV